jgi:3-hydroxyacyl-[acyl-carrier-protein] dehydratase
MKMDIHQILNRLPHRYPFLLVDKVLEIDFADESIIAQKNVTFNEPFFQGHFPDNPVMPGVLMIEALAQATALLAYSLMEDRNLLNPDNIFFLVGIDKVKIKRQVIPGDILTLKSKFTRMKAGIYKCEALALVGDELACTANLTAAYRGATS